jgi:hypothetical protein
MQPVWVLSVDLQTKTATFQSGLSDAAKSARGAFTEIKGGSGEMGRAVSGNMMEARHGVMLLGEEFGIHLPRALTSFIASIGPIGAAMEAAFPFLAIAVGATLLLEHLAKMREEGEKLTEDQVKFGTAVQNAFNQLDSKLIQAQIRADELRNDHLGALKGQLELINRQSMEALIHSFEEVAKAGDVVMKELEGHWYSFGRGSDGAKHALDDFQTHYANLLAQGKSEQASGLLHGTAAQAQKVLQALRDTEAYQGGGEMDDTKFQKGIAAAKVLQKVHVETGVTLTKQIEAQQNLVDVLNAQLSSEERIAALKKLESNNASTATGNQEAAQRAEGQRAAAESMARLGEQSIAADRSTALAQLTIHRASIQERLAMDEDFAGRERDLHLATNQAEIAALDKSGKDYQNQLKALQNKALEITQQYETAVTELKAKAAVESAAKELRELEQAEREKIDGTVKGSAARLAALDAAIKEEEAKGLQDTEHYRDLRRQRVEALRQSDEEAAKLTAEAGQEEAAHEQKIGELVLAAQKQHQALLNSAHRVSDAQRVAQEQAAAEADYQVKMKAFAREESALDKHGKDYQNKLKAIQDKEKQLRQQHQNEITAIEEKAEEERNRKIMSAEDRFRDSISQGLTQVIMGHQSFAKMMSSLGDQVVSGMIQNAIKSMLAMDMTKEKDAAAAARKAFNIGMSMGPAGIVLGPVFGAAAFAAVMAFEKGGEVPGVGRGDIVPAMLEPGEGVVPKGVMAGLSDLAKSGGLDRGGTHYHVQAHFAPQIHAVDADGVDRMLEKHSDRFQRHFETTLRKMNR